MRKELLMTNVSVVVPVYNAGKRLNKCITSILNQNYREFELILVNDGSTDNSLDICKKYERKDNRIKVINKKNEGSILTRRKGVESAISNYIMFVDADDWIDERTIEILYNEALESKAEVTVCNIYKVIGNSAFIKRENINKYFNGNKIYQEEEIKNHLVTAYFHGHPFPSSLCAKLYRKELLNSSGKYLDRIKFLGDDLFYNIEILLKANRVKVINKPLYFYRHGGFTSKFMPYLFEDMINGYLIQKELINEYFSETKQKQYNGISIMLLNTFKTCLNNLFKNNLGQSQIKELICTYISNPIVLECLDNKGVIKYFPADYLEAIRNKNIDYLYNLGKALYKKSLHRKIFLIVASKLSII
ncbi:glycosyltransferase family 2 protein [Neobacillus sp. PS3-12]|uniref:glycosyltransferase family 2 protein n=1 Tax=Neobacillus sp. PS3-12 TaxID=3070677 RepID=UPI0027DF63DD|nr:glycosyltransferase family 2 protein [Neobacillus sp. PS3-12]WML51605.1 glycosyltransferase family 2 protein [Neobacillus sp. PS3-12]